MPPHKRLPCILDQNHNPVLNTCSQYSPQFVVTRPVIWPGRVFTMWVVKCLFMCHNLAPVSPDDIVSFHYVHTETCWISPFNICLHLMNDLGPRKRNMSPRRRTRSDDLIPCTSRDQNKAYTRKVVHGGNTTNTRNTARCRHLDHLSLYHAQVLRPCECRVQYQHVLCMCYITRYLQIRTTVTTSQRTRKHEQSLATITAAYFNKVTQDASPCVTCV